MNEDIVFFWTATSENKARKLIINSLLTKQLIVLELIFSIEVVRDVSAIQ
jgi:hypothetical protein